MGVRRGRYGVDAPWVLAGMVAGAAASLAAAAGGFALGWWPIGLGLLVAGVYFALTAASFAHTTRRGKFTVWERELDALALAGGERVLELGPGRGAVLTAVARRVPAGSVTGVDLWSGTDQSGNTAAVTLRNAAAEEVADRIAIVTGDVRRLPFADGSFDLVVSALVIHNIPEPVGRAAAVAEALRVLRPGGRLRIADIHHAPGYAARLRELGAAEVAVRSLGWRYWYGPPWLATRLVSARRPAR